MKAGRNYLFLFLLPVLVVASMAMLANVVALHNLKQRHESGLTVQRAELALLAEAVQISEAMAVTQEHVADVLDQARAGRLNDSALYRLHGQQVDALAGLAGRVEVLSRALEKKGEREAADALRRDFAEYRNFVIMATDMAAVESRTASGFVDQARSRYISFSRQAHRVSAMLGGRVADTGNAAAESFARAFRQNLLVVSAGLLAMLVLAALAAQAIAGRMARISNALNQLARERDEPPALPAIEHIRDHNHGVLQDLAVSVLSFRQAILERRRAEQALARERGQLKTLVQTIPDLVWLKDPDGVYLGCNPRFERFVGQPEAAIVGKTDFDLLPREQADFFRAHDLAALAKDGPSVNEEWVTFADDQHRELLETTKTPMRDAQGGLVGVLGIGHDITGRKEAESRLKLAASVFTHAREGIMITAPDGTILDVNEAFCRITGYGRNEVLGRTPHLLNSGRHPRAFFAALWRDLVEKGHWSGEIFDQRKNGEVFVAALAIGEVRDDPGGIQHFVALFSDITETKEYERQLERIAHFDALTGLPNRVLLQDRLRQAMNQALRRRQMLAVGYLDLDGFKEVNDRHGHEAGDRLLAALGVRLRECLRDGDTIARVGGDEFVFVMLDLQDTDSYVPTLTRLLAAVAQPVEVNGLSLKVSASLGVTLYPQPGDVDADQLLRQADQAMYQAKVSGKNRFHVFDNDADRSVRGHHEELEHIRAALARREFELHYQPKVNMRTGQLVGAEALIRWRHAEQGLLLPAVFLPVIEGNPLSIELGEWVLDTAMTQVVAWKDAGLHIPISVNLNALHLQQSNFVERLKQLMAAHPGMAPGDLELEVLETSALADIAQASRVIDACHELGVDFALDDFGTGYSSLAYLKRLPAGLLKIDQSFVRDMLDDPDDLAILEGILGLAHAFRRSAIAEGVETAAHGVMLLRLGCELGQGHAIARAMPAADLIGWMAGWTGLPAWNQRARLPRERLPVLFAAVEHRAWVNAIAEYLGGSREMPPQLDHHQCRFGGWLRHLDASEWASHPGLQTVDAHHQRIHLLANELIALKRHGLLEDAQVHLQEIRRLRDQLLAELEPLLG